MNVARKLADLGCALLLCAILGLAKAGAAHADDYAPGQAIVRLGGNADIAVINQVWGASVVDSIPARRVYLLQLSNPVLLDSLITVLSSTPEVIYADYNYNDASPEARHLIVIVVIGGTGQDVEDQNAIARVRAEEANTISDGAGTRVAVLDTGVETDHPFLQGHLDTLFSHDYVEDDLNVYDSANGIDDDGDGVTDGGAGHGTMVAGIVRTIAPGAAIVPIRVLNDEGRGTVFMLTQGIFRALEADADVINLSLGTTSTSAAIHDALVASRSAGVAAVAAAGNDSANTAHYPARDPLAFGVTATDSADVKAAIANYSTTIDLSAPGVGILSSYRGGGFGIGTGTSFAAPFASATVALLRSVASAASPESVQCWTMNGSFDINSIPENEPWWGALGAGRIDCYGAVEIPSAATRVEAALDPNASGVAILSNSPNPFRTETTIRFAVGRDGAARFEIFSLEGRIVALHDLGHRSAGLNTFHFDAAEQFGRAIPPGVYVYRVVAESGRASGRFTIVR